MQGKLGAQSVRIDERQNAGCGAAVKQSVSCENANSSETTRRALFLLIPMMCMCAVRLVFVLKLISSVHREAN